MTRFIFLIFLIICFSQCQEVAEKSLIMPPGKPVNPYRFPGEKYAYVKTYSINRTWDLDSVFYEIVVNQADFSNDVLDDTEGFDEDALMGDFWIGERSIYNSKGKGAKTAQLIKQLTNEEIMKFQKMMVEDNDNIRYGSYCYNKYRDAIVFYNEQDKPVGWINFCFNCGVNSNWRGIYGYQ